MVFNLHFFVFSLLSTGAVGGHQTRDKHAPRVVVLINA
jgi:hypothetical protein